VDEIYGLFRANFSQGLCVNQLSKFIDRDKQVDQAPMSLLEGSQNVQTPYNE
jgi:hypothetical protein